MQPRKEPRPSDLFLSTSGLCLVCRTAGHKQRWPALQLLPHAASVGADHRLAGLAGVGFLELGHVLNRAVHAETAGRVRVCHGTLARFLRRHALTPDLRESQIEALFGSETLDLDRKSTRLNSSH